MDADAGIGGARTAGNEGNARPPGHRTIGARHEGRAPFLPAGNEIDGRRITQRVKHLQEAFAWHGEDTVAALFDQAVDEQAGGGGSRLGGHDRRVTAEQGAGNRALG